MGMTNMVKFIMELLFLWCIFSLLKKEFSPNNSGEDLFIFHPSEEKKVKFTFFMTVFIF